MVKKIIKEEVGTQRLSENNKLLKESSNDYIRNILLKNEDRIKEILIKSSRKPNQLLVGKNLLNKILNLNIPEEDFSFRNKHYHFLELDNNCSIIKVNIEYEGKPETVEVIDIKPGYNLFDIIIKSSGNELLALYSHENEELDKLQKEFKDLKRKYSPNDKAEPGYGISDEYDEDDDKLISSIKYKKSPMLNKGINKITKY